MGFKISTGNIVGLPNQNIESLTNDILLVEKIQPEMVSASPFIPAETTPLNNASYGNIDQTLNTLAIYRKILPTSLIPTVSALEYYPDKGQLKGFNAGANVITINFTPNSNNFPIYATNRLKVKYDHAIETIKKAGFENV